MAATAVVFWEAPLARVEGSELGVVEDPMAVAAMAWVILEEGATARVPEGVVEDSAAVATERVDGVGRAAVADLLVAVLAKVAGHWESLAAAMAMATRAVAAHPVEVVGSASSRAVAAAVATAALAAVAAGPDAEGAPSDAPAGRWVALRCPYRSRPPRHRRHCWAATAVTAGPWASRRS